MKKTREGFLRLEFISTCTNDIKKNLYMEALGIIRNPNSKEQEHRALLLKRYVTRFYPGLTI